MFIPDTAAIFAWAYLDDSPSLQTIDRLLNSIPDGELLAALRAERGRGRNDYPVELCWGVLLLTILLRHPSLEACLAELRRNAALRLRLGALSEDDVPKSHNMSRFLHVLGQPKFLALAEAAFAGMIGELGGAVPDLGRETAGDSTALKGRRERRQPSDPASAALPQPAGGRKEYRDDQGKVVKVLEWFGYKLHLLVDARHELALAYEVTGANADDAQTLPKLLSRAQACLPAGRVQTLAYDKAADSQEFHQALDERQVKPVVQMRNLWKGEPLRELPGSAERPVKIAYDERGAVHCCDATGEAELWREMSFAGHEAARGTLKYRCPALAGDFDCNCERLCNLGKTYGLTVRVKCQTDLRRFPPIPRQTKKFERLYKGRTAIERVNGRLKVFWGADDGNIAGPRRFHAMIAAVMLVHAAFARVLAETPRAGGVLGVARLGSVQQALAEAAAAKASA